jgi:hypothetical protein
VYYTKLVNKYKINEINNEIIYSMPTFDSFDDFLKSKENYDFFWICTCAGICCSNYEINVCPSLNFEEIITFDIDQNLEKCECVKNLHHLYSDPNSTLMTELYYRQHKKKNSVVLNEIIKSEMVDKFKKKRSELELYSLIQAYNILRIMSGNPGLRYSNE